MFKSAETDWDRPGRVTISAASLIKASVAGRPAIPALANHRAGSGWRGPGRGMAPATGEDGQMSSTEQHPSSHRPPGSTHPNATVPDRLFADDGDDQRWRQRFSAIRLSLADPARDVPDHAVYVSNANGRYELYCWDIATDTHSVATHRPDGTAHGTLSADGSDLLVVRRHRRRRVRPLADDSRSAPRPGSSSPAMPTVAPGYPAGLEVGLHVAVAGFVDDDGTRIHLSLRGGEPTVVYRHANDGSVDGLSTRRDHLAARHIPSTATPDTRRCARSR